MTMSDEMAGNDNAGVPISSEEDDPSSNCDEATTNRSVDAPQPMADNLPSTVQVGIKTSSEERKPESPIAEDEAFEGFDTVESEETTLQYSKVLEKEKSDAAHDKSRARSASPSASEEFLGFETEDQTSASELADKLSSALASIEAGIDALSKTLTPLKSVTGAATTPIKALKRPRKDTDDSRPSSGLSFRSDIEGIGSADSSPLARARRAGGGVDVASALLRAPLERGWRREVVYRAALDQHSRRNADIYYYMPSGKKLRSSREVSEHLSGTGLTLENFSFFKEPLGVDDPEKEIIRDAKFMRRLDSPVQPPTPVAVEGKRTPKPKAPKGASPDSHVVKLHQTKLKVKSIGSRISSSPLMGTPPKQLKRTSIDNNNTPPWKKASDEKVVPKKRGLANGATAVADSPRRRGRGKNSAVNHFDSFYNQAMESNYNVVVQIFQYLGMRERARCARVCRLWRQLADTPALWRHVRMKNSHVSDWAGLCSMLKRHGTKRLDLRKMILPQEEAPFWEQFAQNISTVDTLERIEMCVCPSSAVEAVCRGLPSLRTLSATMIRSPVLDPAPLACLQSLHELRLKSTAGLALSADLAPLAALTHLQHLSLTSIKELGSCARAAVGALRQLESLELGECELGAEWGAALRQLGRLRRARLERTTAHCASHVVLRALASLPQLRALELINFDVKVGFDEALAECKNIQRLLIIPTYVSQSATTNRLVLSGVLKLRSTLTHLIWGVTVELLRVTELFIDQCEAGVPEGGAGKRRELGDCIPVLKPVPGCRLPEDHKHVAGPPQVEILPLPTLQRLLTAQMPTTKLKLLRIPFHATWRQTIADFK